MKKRRLTASRERVFSQPLVCFEWSFCKKSVREFVLKMEKQDTVPSQNSIITLKAA